MKLTLNNRPVTEPDPVAQNTPEVPVPGPATSSTASPATSLFVEAEPPAKMNHLLRLFLGLVVCFLFFYVLADYTGYTAGQLRPGELVFSNTMVQLWTATYRLAYIVAVALALIGLVWQGLWQFFRPTADRNFDLATSIKNDLTPAQRIWLFFIVFFSLCFLFVLLLSVKLPESISVSP